MKSNTICLLAFAGALVVCPVFGAKNAPLELGGVACTTPPPMHCPDANCGALVTEQGTAVEPKTGRKYFLDYPCDLKKNEKVTFILALHGGGSYGNWQRHYFPIVDYKDKYRLVIATPNAPPRVWAATDDEYLQNIVNLVYEQVGKANIKQFWLVGHSQGGITSNRLIRTDFFKQRVDGWLSLSGGRLGGNPGRGSFSNLGRPAASSADKMTADKAGTPPAGRPGGASAFTALREPPDANISFIYETGQFEMDDKGMPETSAWAEKYNCGARVKRPDVVDTKPGYVYDSTRQDPGSDAWGRLPRPGTAQIFEYPKCQGGHIVADVVRLNKGHTEGLEPHITEQLVKMMLSAKR
ncbi:MAG TPA: alpha/beta hydrolase [Bryobacteraceae bacterium]|jgi:pimeloyl-ACP methyl ester carboxylesterase|nr:alpha/beta hydrolase [Bryobacteraceae bacterium]